MMSRRAIGIALSGWLVAGDIAAGTAADMLARMGDAVQQQNYRGTFVYRHGERIETVAIVHRSQDGMEQERIVTLSGTPLEIVRDGEVVKCVLPDNRSVKVEKSPQRLAFRPRLPADAQRLEPHYAITLAGTDTVANRGCQVVEVRPLDDLRYGMRLCLDDQSALPLSSTLVTAAEGVIVEQVVFTTIEFPARIADAELALRTPVEGYAWHVKEAGEAARQVEPAGAWEATRLPAGFRLAGEHLKRAVPTGAPVHHLVFSDGLAAVSVFIEPVDPDRKGIDGAARRGAISVFGREVGGHQVTVMGEVPPATVELIAGGIVPRPVRGQP